MNSNRKPINWQLVVFIGTIVITVLFIAIFLKASPETFWHESTTPEGQIVKTFDCGKIYEMIIDGMSAWGAILIGIIALGQSENSQKLAEKLAKKESSCSVLISNHNYSKEDRDFRLSNEHPLRYEESDNFISLDFENYSDVFMKEIYIFFGNEKFYSHITLVKEKNKYCKIYLPKSFDPSANIVCNIVFVSCNNEKTYGDFNIKQYNTNPPKIIHYHFYGSDNYNNVPLSWFQL